MQLLEHGFKFAVSRSDDDIDMILCIHPNGFGQIRGSVKGPSLGPKAAQFRCLRIPSIQYTAMNIQQHTHNMSTSITNIK